MIGEDIYLIYYSRDEPPRIHIAQNIAETCQKYLQYFIAIEILSQHFCQILQNISSQHYSLSLLKHFWKQINI